MTVPACGEHVGHDDDRLVEVVQQFAEVPLGAWGRPGRRAVGHVRDGGERVADRAVQQHPYRCHAAGTRSGRPNVAKRLRSWKSVTFATAGPENVSTISECASYPPVPSGT